MTTMGMGRVRMKTPERAQKPPMILPGQECVRGMIFKNKLQLEENGNVLPSKVLGFMSYPTVVIVIKPHLSKMSKM